jgi:hypothetical protein
MKLRKPFVCVLAALPLVPKRYVNPLLTAVLQPAWRTCLLFGNYPFDIGNAMCCSLGASTDSAVEAGAPDDEIEITHEMIRAGEACLDDLFDASIEPYSDRGLMCSPGVWAERVFQAMWRKRNRPASVGWCFKISNLIILERCIP